jgi:hypothetical protein
MAPGKADKGIWVANVYAGAKGGVTLELASRIANRTDGDGDAAPHNRITPEQSAVLTYPNGAEGVESDAGYL